MLFLGSKEKSVLYLVILPLRGETATITLFFSCIRALPESMEYKTSDVNGEHIEVKQGYRRQVVYMEPQTEFETTKQAIRIKQLFTDFDADYCVLDTRNAGIAIYDALAKVLYDVERNVEYEPWSCMNDDNLRSRIVIAGQKEVVYSIKAQLETNSKIAVCMKNTLNSKMIELRCPIKRVWRNYSELFRTMRQQMSKLSFFMSVLSWKL